MFVGCTQEYGVFQWTSFTFDDLVYNPEKIVEIRKYTALQPNNISSVYLLINCPSLFRPPRLRTY